MATIRSRHEDADDELDDGENPSAGDQVRRDLLVAERVEPEEGEDLVVDQGHGGDAPEAQLSSLLSHFNVDVDLFTSCFLYFATRLFTRSFITDI